MKNVFFLFLILNIKRILLELAVQLSAIYNGRRNITEWWNRTVSFQFHLWPTNIFGCNNEDVAGSVKVI